MNELQRESKKYQDQTVRMKKQHLDWNEGLSSKVTEMREQKKTWIAEANALRSAKVDLEVRTTFPRREGQRRPYVVSLESRSITIIELIG